MGIRRRAWWTRRRGRGYFFSRSSNGSTWTTPATLNTNATLDGSKIDRYPSVAIDGSGNWIVSWISTNNLGGSIGTDWDILYSRSTNGGASWSVPAALNSTAATDGSAYDVEVEMASDGAGNWIAVWYSNNSFGGLGADPDILYSRSTNNGISWSAASALPSNAASDSGGDYAPQVVSSGGTFIVSWESYDTLGGTTGFDGDIFYVRSTNGGSTWSSTSKLNQNASVDGGEDYAIEMTGNGSGTWLAVWTSDDRLLSTVGFDEDVFSARSTDDGITWTSPVAISANAVTDEAPQIATSGLGMWISVWTKYNTITDDNDLVYYRPVDNGTNWTAPIKMSDDWDNLYAKIGHAGGTWVSIWHYTDIPGGDILYSRSVNNGENWTFPGVLASGTAPPPPDADGDGLSDYEEFLIGTNPLVADTDGDGLNDGLEVNTYGTNPLDSDSDNDGLTNGVEVNTHGTNPLNRDSDGDGLGDYHEINTYFSDPLDTDSDNDGLNDWDEVKVVGTDPNDSDTDDDGLNDGDEVYTHSTNPLDNDSDNDGLSDGEEVNTYGTDPNDSDSDNDGVSDGDEVAAGSNPLSLLEFLSPTLLNNNSYESGVNYSPQITTSGNGTWISVWSSPSSLGGTIGTDLDILYAVSTNNGTTWSNTAYLNSNAATDSADDYSPQITTNGAGTWIATWNSGEYQGEVVVTDHDIFYAISTNNGSTWSNVAFLNNGATTDSAGDYFPQLTTDGTGTWIATWMSSDNLGNTIGTDYDILYAASTNNGATWSKPVPLNSNAETDSGADYSPQLTTDGVGNWIAAWQSDDSLGDTIGEDWDVLYASVTLPESDGDGLVDYLEIELGSNPNDVDTDNDGIDDGDEVRIYGTDPTDADTDDDGISDWDEIYKYGTNPIDTGDVVSVDFAWGGNETGSPATLCNTFSEAKNAVSADGLVYIDGGSSITANNWNGQVNTPMKIVAHEGPGTIGN